MIYVFLADGFEEIEAVAPIDILRRAGYRVVLVKIKKAKIYKSVMSKIADIFIYQGDEFSVAGSHDIELKINLQEKEIIFSEKPEKVKNQKYESDEEAELYEPVFYVEDLEMIVLPGGADGVANLYESETVRKIIDYCVEHKIPIGAICAAPSILARLGYLKDIKATAYPTFRHYLTENGAVLEENEKVITDGIFTTAAAAGVSIEFGLELVRVLKGEDEAKKIGEQILFY